MHPKKQMSENAYVVVFPSVFSKNRISEQIKNIKKILTIQNQKFGNIKRDDSVVVIEANDPVFASSAINLLFGIEKIAIAKKVSNEFNSIVSSVSKLGANLLLKDEKFYVKIEGKITGHVPKDLEIAATSALIEKSIKLGAKPGTENNYDKLLYTFLTKSNAYVCIFIDQGGGGVPFNSQNEKIICCIYDELSAVSCLQAIKNGFDVNVIVCYRNESDLLHLVKILSKLLPRLVSERVNVKFISLNFKETKPPKIILTLEIINEILILAAKEMNIKKIAIATPYTIFPSKLIDSLAENIFKQNLVPHIPLSGLDDDIIKNVKEMGLAKHLPKIEKLGTMNLQKVLNSKSKAKSIAKESFKAKKSIIVSIGPNIVHDIIDSIKSNH